MKKIIVTMILMILGFAGSVLATTIDFRSNNFSNAAGTSFYEYTSAGLIIEASTYSSEGTSTYSSKLFWSRTDGLGVGSSGGYEYDEIEGSESLHLAFTTQQLLKSLMLTDLFTEKDKNGEYYQEIGAYSFDNKIWYYFSADTNELEGQSNGELILNLSSPVVTRDVWFKAIGKLKNGTDHDFSVAYVEITPVPEPETMLLFWTGLLFLAGFGIRFKIV